MRNFGILIALVGFVIVVGQTSAEFIANDLQKDRTAGIIAFIVVTLIGIGMSLSKSPPTGYDKTLSLLAKPFLIGFLYLYWIAATAIPVLCLILLKNLFEGVALVSAIVALLGIPLLLFSVVGSLWLSLATVRHLCDEDRAFLRSLKLAIADLRGMLMFLPFIGRFFTPSDVRENGPTDHVID